MPTDARPCRVCLVQHDEEIHAATLSVHIWFHDQVTQGFYEDFDDQAIPLEAQVESQVA